MKITRDGVAKVLDFGLAKLAEPAPIAQSEATLTASPATCAGVTLGTAAYMSPEQARGMTVDKRADIWAFGVVLYEMHTDSQTFPGENYGIRLESLPVFPRLAMADRVAFRDSSRICALAALEFRT